MLIFGPIDPHTWPSEAKNLELWVPKWLCDTSLAPMFSDKLPFSPAWHSRRRMEAPILCHTYFGTQIIFFKGLMRVIRKTEMREFDFWCAAVTQKFLLIFSLFKICRKLHKKHSLWKEKRKSMSLNGTIFVYSSPTDQFKDNGVKSG